MCECWFVKFDGFFTVHCLFDGRFMMTYIMTSSNIVDFG